jgi:hypothetical protein
MPAGIRKQYRRYGGKMAEKNQPRKVGFLKWWWGVTTAQTASE